MASLLFDKPRLRHSGDMAILVEYGDAIDPAINEKVRAVTTLLKRNLPEGVLAIVPRYRSLSIRYDPLQTSPESCPWFSTSWKGIFGRWSSRRPASSRSPSAMAATWTRHPLRSGS
jgi:hypothetical protein